MQFVKERLYMQQQYTYWEPSGGIVPALHQKRCRALPYWACGFKPHLGSFQNIVKVENSALEVFLWQKRI